MESAPARRFGYGVVASAFGVQAVSIGLSVAVYPVFVESLESGLGATRTQASFGIPLVLLSGALVAPWTGRAVDLGSPRVVMITGAVMMMLGMVAVSLAPSLLWATAAWVLFVGPGHTLVGPLPAMTVITNWFIERRSTMIAIAAIGTTFGGALAPPAAELLIGRMGWRGAVLILGVAAAAIAIPIVLLGIRKSPEEVGEHPDGASESPPPPPKRTDRAVVREILTEPGFWFVGIAFALITGLGVAFLTHEVPFAVERGLSRQFAVGLLTLSAIGSASGKVVFGRVTDRLGPRRAVYMASTLQLLGWGGLIVAPGAPSFACAAAILSLGMGCNMPVQAAFVAGIFGRARFGRASGLLGLVTIAGTFSLAPLIGAGFDATGSYDSPFSWALGLLALPPVLLSFVRLEGETAAPLREAVHERSL